MKSWQERADACLAQGCVTYSRRSDQFIRGVMRTHVKNGDGAHLKMDDGRIVIDHTCGLGSNIISCTNNYGLPTTDEVVLAEMIKRRFPFISKLKLCKTGSAATQAAIRIARAYQQNRMGLNKHYSVRGIGIGYHGTDNWSIASEKPGSGTWYEGYSKYDTIKDVLYHLSNINSNGSDLSIPGYVIIEPVMLDIDVRPYLLQIRELCDKHEIVLIFDEIITGFRTPKYCFANFFDIKPDIICLGKAMGNGFPISCVGGKSKFMDTPGYFISSTFSGDHASIMAAIGTMNFLTLKRIKDLWKIGSWFQYEFNKLSPRVQLYGIPTRAVWKGTEEDKALFMQEMYREGVLFGKAWWISFSHTKELLEKELELANIVFKRIESGEAKLEGQLPTEIFKRN